MKTDLRLEVRSEPQFLQCARAALRTYLAQLKLDEDRIMEAVLAVDEAASNCMRHAYEGDTDHIVWIELCSDESTIEIRVSDRGKPCPKEHLVRRELVAPAPGDLTPGGLGIQLIYSVFDEVAFKTEDDPQENRVEMRLRRGDTG